MSTDSPDTPQYPTFLEQIKNLTELAKTIPQDLVNNNEIFVTDEVRLQRWNTCKSCEHFISQDSRCELCGCFMQPKVKLTRSTCPAWKW